MATDAGSDDNVEALLVTEPGLAEDELPVSHAFMDLVERAGKYSQEDLLSQLQASLALDGDDAPGQSADPERTEASLALLSETLNVFATLAEDDGPVGKGLSEVDRSALEALRTVLNERFSGSDELVVNTAPPGQLPWEILGVDEDRGAVHWAADLTEGRSVSPWKAAALSFDTKVHMYQLHLANPEKYTPAALAKEFGVREQRVRAILALKEMEAATLSALPAEEAEAAMVSAREVDSELGPGEGVSGEGERHHVVLPSYPNYGEVDMAAFASRLEARLGKPMADITEADLTPELAAAVLGHESKEAIEARLAAVEESHLVEEFSSRLAFNLGKEGAGLQRKSRRTHFPRRPRAGWGLLVKPLGAAAAQEGGAYVAERDGSRREPTADEALLLRRQTPRRRRRIL